MTLSVRRAAPTSVKDLVCHRDAVPKLFSKTVYLWRAAVLSAIFPAAPRAMDTKRRKVCMHSSVFTTERYMMITRRSLMRSYMAVTASSSSIAAADAPLGLSQCCDAGHGRRCGLLRRASPRRSSSLERSIRPPQAPSQRGQLGLHAFVDSSLRQTRAAGDGDPI
jgi:hypothetical protein